MKIQICGQIEYWDTPETSKYGKWRAVVSIPKDSPYTKTVLSTMKEVRTSTMRSGKSVQELVDAGADEYYCVEKKKDCIWVKASSGAPKIPIEGSPQKGDYVSVVMDIYPLYITSENKAMVVARLEGVSVKNDEFSEDGDDPFDFE